MLTLICGLSRAGKTTYSSLFENVIHLDECIMGFHGGPYTGVLKCLADIGDKDVVVEGIYDTPERRSRLIDGYMGNGPFKCIWMNTPDEVRRTRNGHFGTEKHFDPPTTDEGWDEIVVIDHVPEILDGMNKADTHYHPRPHASNHGMHGRYGFGYMHGTHGHGSNRQGDH